MKILKHIRHINLLWAVPVLLLCIIIVLLAINRQSGFYLNNFEQIEIDCESQKKEEIGTIEKWIETLPQENQLKAKKEYLNNIEFVPFQWSPYKGMDSIGASLLYDSLLRQVKLFNTPWDKVIFILKIVYENANQGDYEKLFPDLNAAFDSLNAKEQFIAFKLNRYAGGCAEYADFAVKLLNEAGIIAAILNLSSADSEGILGLHSLPICLIDNKLIVLDPLFPQYYAYKDSLKPIEFGKMYQLVKSGNSEQIDAVIIRSTGGHYLQPFDGLPCYPVNSGIFGYTNVSACYNLDSAFMLLDCHIYNAFADTVLFNKRKIDLLKRQKLDINYLSFFYFTANLSGKKNDCDAISKLLSESGIEIDLNQLNNHK